MELYILQPCNDSSVPQSCGGNSNSHQISRIEALKLNVYIFCLNLHPPLQNFVGNLTLEPCQMLVAKGYNYVEGVAMAQSFVQQEQVSRPPPSNILPWCVCSHCRPMECEVENVCCRQRHCITLSSTFEGVALDRSILCVAIVSCSDLFTDDPDYNPASYRKAAYRQFIVWYHGHLGQGNRRVVPSCVVWRLEINTLHLMATI